MDKDKKVLEEIRELPANNIWKLSPEFKTKVDEVRESLTNFGKEYLNEWKDNYGKVFDIHREHINYDETVNEMTDNTLGLIKLPGAFVGDPNNLEGAEIPKFDFNNIVDLDFSTLYPSYFYGPFRKVKHMPWKKVRIMQQFENAVDCAIWDYQATYISVVIKGKDEYKEELKYRKRVANRMILQWKDHRAGKKKSVVNRKRRKK